ncbi:RNA recognition motif domain [Fusarium albosuccineum]|uniref:RNA recognition motif domain n=1 Tax=Fusarium albosuccineum TaxID=1237068 RepID=A0A8H4LMB0_9HYPO|nr:RNA recognition motif domain [Fusarium albosuccineum]
MAYLRTKLQRVEDISFRVSITAPAIWPPYAQSAMREVAKLVGITDERPIRQTLLELVQEPEAAGLSIMLERSEPSNLPYEVKPYDVEEVLASNGFGDLDKIHISVDPVSARNPGYCFVDFHDRETADRALSSLSATIRGRSIKVGPCKPKKTNERRDNRDEGSTSRRWGDWNASDDRRSRNEQADSRREQRGPNWALDHFDDMVQTGSLEGRRLYVGGLDKMIDQDQHQRELAELFSGFTPHKTDRAAISKRITPHESTRSQPGNHHYCFVDFDTKEEASAAVEALNGKPIEGGFLKVSISRKMPRKLVGRQTDDRYRRRHDGPYSRPHNSRYERRGESNNAMSSDNWRPNY